MAKFKLPSSLTAKTTTVIQWKQPLLTSHSIEGNAVHANLDFFDGRGIQNIIIKKGNGFYMWIDLPFQIRKFTSLEYLAYEFELPQKLVSILSAMPSGEVTEKPFMDMKAMQVLFASTNLNL